MDPAKQKRLEMQCEKKVNLGNKVIEIEDN